MKWASLKRLRNNFLLLMATDACPVSTSDNYSHSVLNLSEMIIKTQNDISDELHDISTPSLSAHQFQYNRAQICNGNASPLPTISVPSTSSPLIRDALSTHLMICIRCLQPIAEPFLLLVAASLPFHADCLTCAECSCPLGAAPSQQQPPPSNNAADSCGVFENNGELAAGTLRQHDEMQSSDGYPLQHRVNDSNPQQFCGTCFFRDGNVYCRTHYVSRFVRTNCAKCSVPIQPNECVMRVEAHIPLRPEEEAERNGKPDCKLNENVTRQSFRTELRHFHVSCFSCNVCQQALQRREFYRYVAAENMLLCKDHIEHVPFEPNAPGAAALAKGNATLAVARPKTQGKVGRPRKRKANGVAALGATGGGDHFDQHLLQQQSLIDQQQQQLGQGSNIFSCQALQQQQQLQTHANSSNIQHQTPQQSQRPKRMRTSFKHQQLKSMKTFFTCNQNPDAKDLKQLSTKTGLSKRVLQVWFQNARAKNRRHYAKARHQDASQQQQQSGATNTTQLLQPTSSSSAFFDQLGAAVSSRDFNSSASLSTKNSSIPAVQSLPAPPPPSIPLSIYGSRLGHQQYHSAPADAVEAHHQAFMNHNMTRLATTFSSSTTLDINHTSSSPEACLEPLTSLGLVVAQAAGSDMPSKHNISNLP